MTDPRTLPQPYPRIAEALELAAGALEGHVAYETNIRARKTGDLLDVDAAMYLPAGDDESLYLVTFRPGDAPVEVDAVDTMERWMRGASAAGAAIVAGSGFSRPARKRADEYGVALITPGEQESEGLPSWLANGGFESQKLEWRIRNISLPPIQGLPKNLFENEYKISDEIFANPQGRKFTATELFRRWLKAQPNYDGLVSTLPRTGEHITRAITLNFDRPMHILANTVKELPPVRWTDFVVEAWLNVHRVPMTLVESPVVELQGNPPCAYASEHGIGGSETGRLWMWLGAAPGPGADREVHMQVIEEVPEESH